MAVIETDRPGRVARWKLAEPLRLYVYGWSLLVVLVAAVAAALSGSWLHLLTVVLVVVLEVPAIEAARASVYSPRSVVQTVLRVRGQ